MSKLSLNQLDLKGKRVLIRVDFNVPLDGSTVTDDTRIREALPTIRKVLQDGGLPILMSHLGRPKDGFDAKYSLAPVAAYLQNLMGVPVHFSPETIGEKAQSVIDSAEMGSIVVLENTRFYPQETKNDPEFSKSLAALGDVYVNDAFGSAHRAHASTEGITHFIRQSAMGYLLQKEVEYLGQALENPQRLFVAVIGGAKVSDKIGVIEALLPKVDHLLIGGGMSYTFLKAQGFSIGKSLVEDDKLDLAKSLLEKAGGKIELPSDHLISEAFSNDAPTKTVAGNIPDGWMALDIGEETIGRYESILHAAKTVIWNGPMGVFEMPTFAKGTLAIAKKLAVITRLGATTIVGGGDSVAAITQAKLNDDVSHVSTGGGAMLEFLEGITLPGVAAINEA